MRIFVQLGFLAVAVLWGPFSVGALEPFAVYEKWNDDPDKLIRSDRWRGDEDSGGTEVTRQITAVNKLLMRYRLEGFVVTTTPPTGQVVARNYLRFTNPTSLTAIRAKLNVNQLSIIPCEANNAAATTQAGPTHIALARFNDGTSTGPSDRTGDIEGVIATFRNGSSLDAAGILQVSGSVIRSTAASGNFNSTLGSVALGTVNVGTVFTLEMAWDKPNKRFLFSLNGGVPLAVTYTVSDSVEAVSPFAQIFQRPAVANCHDAVPVVDATTIIRKVWTNASGIIP